MPMFSDLSNSIKPPEYHDPAEARARLLTLGHLVQQQQMGAQQMQLGQLQLEQHQRDAADDMKLREAYPRLLQDSGGDSGKLLNGIAGLGVSPKIVQTMQQNMIANDEKRGITTKNVAEAKHFDAGTAEKQIGVLASATGALLQVPPEQRPYAYVQMRGELLGNKNLGLPPSDLPEQYPGDGWLLQHHNAGLSAQQQLEAHIKEQDEARKAAMAPSQLRSSEAEAGLNENKLKQITSANTPAEFAALVDQIVPPGVKENAALNARTKAAVAFALKSGDIPAAKAALTAASAETRQLEIATDPRIAKQKININLAEAQGREGVKNAAATSGPLTADDYKRAGAEYAITGVMPQLGNGSGAVKQRLLHEKNEFGRENNLSPRDMAVAKAAFSGDAKSLASFQTQRDAIVSFEETAKKNLDNFLSLAAKLPDTGVPWLNTPIRMLDDKLVGSDNMAAVNAARTVANNEIAKVTAGGGLGGVLSDSARHEVESYNPANATIKQTIAIAKVLKSDMSARHTAMDHTLAAIRDRAGTFGRGPETQSAPAAAPGKQSDPLGIR